MACSVALVAIALAWQPDPTALIPMYKQALAASEQQFGPDHPKVARSASDLGLFLRNQGDLAGAAPYLRRALEIDEKALGEASPLTGEDIENLASALPPAEAAPLYRRAAEHKDAAVAARNLARVASYEEAQGHRDAALALYRKALAKEQTASRLNDVALLVAPAEAEPLLRRALAIQEKTLSGANPETAATLNNLADVLLAAGRTAQAEPLARRALAMLEATLGPRHPRVATASSNLADILRAKKDYTGARRYYERALAVDEAAYGPGHTEIAVDLENLAGLLSEMGRPSEARRIQQRAQAIKAAQ
jgi:tetratricopeptide (TPR) repeat protein